jgi:hypothetical protein
MLSVNTAAIEALIGRLEGPGITVTGTVAVTLGRVVSGNAPVVNVQL